MPEGDTIHRAARTLHAALAGRTVTRFETVLPKLARVEVAGRTIEGVRAEGKNLLMDFSGDLHLHTHMRMHGSWHLYRPGERWRKRRSDMRIVLETDTWIAVGFNIPVASFDAVIEIGPDFLAESFDADEALRRMRERDADEIADVLLNQRVAAGIGNEYKSEVLFLGRINPFAPTAKLTDEQLRELLRIARKLMVANIQKRAPGRNTTFSLDRSQSKYVYGRAGKPCRKCGTPVLVKRQGRDARLTFWCPRCQPV
ncbi:MAG TPA: DNA-formamidopyrimidine glycosylase family protein [Thermoanaerobaculia bacterium]|nr:DNA-formamidopyrimidine glycosylase family protein [Thermoanaerobaculia bacterium]